MSKIIVRCAVKEDMERVMNMIIELATFEGHPNGAKITAEDLIRDGFETDPPFFVSYVAEYEDSKELVGYAVCNFAYSSWSGKAMYIEDFYVKEGLRGHKIGHRIFKEVCKTARDKGCHRIDWHVLLDNDIAIKFYKSHGGIDICESEKRTAYRLYNDDILKIANSSE